MYKHTSGPEVAPTVVTYIDEAGKIGLYPHIDSSIAFEAPASPCLPYKETMINIK